jgi:hypothetical protein
MKKAQKLTGIVVDGVVYKVAKNKTVKCVCEKCDLQDFCEQESLPRFCDKYLGSRANFKKEVK